MRDALCKECQRENGDLEVSHFRYAEDAAERILEQGGSRSDRCPEHRRKHRQAIEGLAVAYIDLETVGEVADRENPTGPLGGLGPLPAVHREIAEHVDLDAVDMQLGMSDSDVLDLLHKLADNPAGVTKRVGILEAGTGTGKSTFAPFRLMNPPPGAPLRLTDNGPIIVTQPRQQAATGVARAVAEHLCRTGCGPGNPVGYQVKGDKKHDASCRLIYVTDGTLINWLREGRLASIGAVIVDEAHERSENIDFILGFLKRELPKHPHLRVIIASATIDIPFFREYFGGEEAVAHKYVEPVKTFGYGVPLYARPTQRLEIEKHWPRELWATTQTLDGLRFEGSFPREPWPETAPPAVAEQIIKLIDQAPPGDILAFLPTRRTIERAVDLVEARVSKDLAEVLPLLSSTDKGIKERALAERLPGAKRRKVVISSNLAETSLTVKGVRYIVDSGLIAQSEWDPVLAKESVPTRRHSRAGLKQRWGRVGRDAPGWVFTLYSEEELASDDFPSDTAPGSARANAESLLVKAKAGGIDDVSGFPWPTNFKHDRVERDKEGQQAVETFNAELKRAQLALHSNGALDGDGHLTPLGHEVERLSSLPVPPLAVMYADQLACLPEVVVALTALQNRRLVGRDGLLRYDDDWPTAWRVLAKKSHRALAAGCPDDLALALRAYRIWETADDQDEQASHWWLNHALLTKLAGDLGEVLEALSPGMKEEATRPIDLSLAMRARAVISRTLASSEYVRRPDGLYDAVSDPTLGPFELTARRLTPATERVIGLDGFQRTARSDGETDRYFLSNLVAPVSWARDGAPDPLELMLRAAGHPDAADEDRQERAQLALMEALPLGARFRCKGLSASNEASSVEIYAPPFAIGPDHQGQGGDLAEREDTFDPNAASQPDLPPEEVPHQIIDTRGEEENEYSPPRPEVSEKSPPSHQRAERSIQLLLPPDVGRVESEEGLIVVGYSDREGVPAVEVRRDPRPAHATSDPAVLSDLTPGDEVALRVGPLEEDHRGPVRVLERVDGNGCLFLEHSHHDLGSRGGGKPPAGLGDRDAGVLERLEAGTEVTGTVLPGSGGTTSVTILPWLWRDLEAAPSVVLESSGSGRRERHWPAVVMEVPEGTEWAEIEIRGTRLAHRFGVHRNKVSCALAEGATGYARLSCSAPWPLGLHADTPELTALAEEHRKWISRRADKQAPDKLYLFPRRELIPNCLIGELAALKEDGQWQARVWAWYAAAFCQRCEALVEAESAEVLIPAHLREPLRKDLLAQVTRESGAKLTLLHDADSITVLPGDPKRVQAAEAAIQALAHAPATWITVPSERIGKVRGKGGERLRELQANLVWCGFSDGDLLLIADAPAEIAWAVGVVRPHLEGAEAALHLPEHKNGLLIGRGGTTKQQLLAQSGCTYANPDGGNGRWIVRGPSKENIRTFERLAKKIVPESQLGSIKANILEVRDAHSGKPVVWHGTTSSQALVSPAATAGKARSPAASASAPNATAAPTRPKPGVQAHSRLGARESSTSAAGPSGTPVHPPTSDVPVRPSSTAADGHRSDVLASTLVKVVILGVLVYLALFWFPGPQVKRWWTGATMWIDLQNWVRLDLRDSCEPADYVPTRALGGMDCNFGSAPWGSAGYVSIDASYFAFEDKRSRDRYWKRRSNAAGVRLGPEGSCRTPGHRAKYRSTTVGQTLPGGRVLCYRRNGIAWIEWTYDKQPFYMRASQEDGSFSKLYTFWRTKAGPAPLGDSSYRKMR
jgi:HrpA-like RNA helicase